MLQVSSGVASLDPLLRGGFLKPSVIYLVGAPGTGKTTLSMQFVCEGARLNEKCIYFSTLGEPPLMALSFMSPFSFFNEKYFDENVIEFIDLSGAVKEEDFLDSAVRKIKENVARLQAQRVVLDSVAPFVLRAKNDFDYRSILFDLFIDMKAWGCTTIAIGEIDTMPRGPEHYLADCVIKTGYYRLDRENHKYIQVVKMRGIAHDTGLHTLKITRDGIMIEEFPSAAILLNGCP
ncbi:MAG: ATPase domain-containing protein [Thermoplasmata archaeon]